MAMFRAALLTGLLLGSPFAAAGDEQPLEQDSQWMAMLLNGSKTGYMHLERSVFEDRVINRETFVIELDRGGTELVIRSEDEVVETPAGEPLSFTSRQKISDGEMVIHGNVAPDGTVHVVSEGGGSRQEQSFPWDPQAHMSEGLRQLTLEHGLEPGTRFTTKAFIPGSLQTYEVTVDVGEMETVDLFGVEADLYRVEQTMMMGQVPTRAVAWVNEDYDVKKMTLTLMGMELETIACPRECATSASEPTEFFTSTFARAPRGLARDERDGSITYHIRALNPATEITFPESGEQQVERDESGQSFKVTVHADSVPRATPVTAEADGFLKQTRWLQSDAPALEELAQKARGDASLPLETMQALERFVRDYVSDKNLSVGYASALEVVRNRSGDCTEHALLLAALGRALGIPTRVATGLAYVDGWLGAEHVFVPHAWAQAVIDGHWVSFDAALGDFDAGHIALAYGDGDPWRFYDGVNALGNIEILRVETTAP